MQNKAVQIIKHENKYEDITLGLNNLYCLLIEQISMFKIAAHTYKTTQRCTTLFN